MPYANPYDPRAVRTDYYKAYYSANRDRIRKRADNWRRDNRERSNALRRLLDLRKMKNPLPRHIRKMAEICERFPKRRIVLKMSSQ